MRNGVFGGTTQAIEIVVTNRTAMLSGTVLDESGARARVLVPADLTGDWSPLVPFVPTTSEGTFKLAAQRAGEYWIAAVDVGQLFPLVNSGSKNVKTRILKVAQHVQLSEGERRMIDLRIVKVPEDRCRGARGRRCRVTIQPRQESHHIRDTEKTERPLSNQ